MKLQIIYITFKRTQQPKEVGRVYGDDDPCNGFTSLLNKIYAVYNEEIKCIGFHEDAHVVSYLINRPNSRAIREGVAMYFDRKWWGIQNLDWAGYFIKTGKYISVNKLFDNEVFSSNDCSITYPIMGAFTEWLISSYGIDKYLQFYKYEDSTAALKLVYDENNEREGTHPLNHIDVNYATPNTYKIGLYNRWNCESMIDFVNIKKPCSVISN